LRISSPPHGATYLIDPTLRRDFQTLALRAVAPEAAQIEWMIDGAVVGSSSAAGVFAWPLTPGTHRIEVRDDRGGVDTATVTVR
jgi:membrane carboxypeptidase/penicillin-binding protein PbpC